MLHLLLSAAPAALLVALMIGLVPIRLGAEILTANTTFESHGTGSGAVSDSDAEARWARDEFAFERAIESYEKLIDETAEGHR